MKNSQKGFIIPVVIMIVILLGLGVVKYYDNYNKPTELPPVVSDEGGSKIENKDQVAETVTVGSSTPAEIESIVKANNQFAFDLYDLYKDGKSNVFFSPFSIHSALLMTYEGAKGKTAEEMYGVLNLFPDCRCIKAPCICDQPEERRNAFANVYNSLNSGSSDYKLATANALWAEKTYSFLPAYFKTVETYYGGKVTNLDFKNQAEEGRVTINTWVEKQTNNKIKDLIPKGMVDKLTRLVLTNAVYFKGTWQIEFDPKRTYTADFFVNQAETVQTNMMSLSGEKAVFNYSENEDWQSLELPYKGNRLSMLVLLPKTGQMSVLEKSLNNDYVQSLRNTKKQKRQVDVYLPKFKFETKNFMAQDLAGLGMPSAFNPAVADFSGMNGNRELFIGEVIHQAFVEVNEEGTEAAAATAVIIKMTSAGPGSSIPVFRADHPFIFLIQDNQTGEILFMGKVVKPGK